MAPVPTSLQDKDFPAEKVSRTEKLDCDRGTEVARDRNISITVNYEGGVHIDFDFTFNFDFCYNFKYVNCISNLPFIYPHQVEPAYVSIMF